MSTPTPSQMIAADLTTLTTSRSSTAPAGAPDSHSPLLLDASPMRDSADGDQSEEDAAVSVERCYTARSADVTGPMVTFYAPDAADVEIADLELSWGSFATPELYLTRNTDGPPPPYTPHARAVRFRIGTSNGLRALGDTLVRLADAAESEVRALAGTAPAVEVDVRPVPPSLEPTRPAPTPPGISAPRRSAPAGLPAVEYTVHRATAYAEISAGNGAEVSIARSGGGAGAGTLLLDVEAHGLRFVGSRSDGANFELDDEANVRTLAAALLGALGEAERRGIIAPSGATDGAAPP